MAVSAHAPYIFGQKNSPERLTIHHSVAKHVTDKGLWSEQIISVIT